MKRSGPLRRNTPLRAKGKSDTAKLKNEIQSLLRSIVIIRDGGCILRNIRHCGGTPNTPGVVLQADHLVTRANSATFADSRLVVCVCRSCHYWKSVGSNRNKAQYDALVKTIIESERVRLWERAEQDSWRPHRTSASDWRLEIAALRQELTRMAVPEWAEQ